MKDSILVGLIEDWIDGKLYMDYDEIYTWLKTWEKKIKVEKPCASVFLNRATTLSQYCDVNEWKS